MTELIFLSARNDPYFIIGFIILIFLVSLPFIFLGKRRKTLYPYNEKISKRVRDFLVAVHFIGSIVLAIVLTKYFQYHVNSFEVLFKKKTIWIPVVCVILIVINSAIIGLLIEFVFRGINKFKNLSIKK